MKMSDWRNGGNSRSRSGESLRLTVCKGRCGRLTANGGGLCTRCLNRRDKQRQPVK